MDSETRSRDLDQAASLEREAHQFRTEQKIDAAFNAYNEAASLYRHAGESLKAAVCFASAATCWNIHTGLQPLRNAATRNHWAAQEAMKAGYYDYARSLFREAAMLYEKEADSENYSDCFWQSQTADAKRSWDTFAHSKKQEGLIEKYQIPARERALAFFRWCQNGFGRIAWGYGERPFRAFILAAFVIVGSAFFYWSSGRVAVYETLRPISFWESLYFSIITYATVGYGDFTPEGWVRIVSACEALAGIFLSPLFLVGLTRRYLRMYR